MNSEKMSKERLERVCCCGGCLRRKERERERDGAGRKRDTHLAAVELAERQEQPPGDETR